MKQMTTTAMREANGGQNGNINAPIAFLQQTMRLL